MLRVSFLIVFVLVVGLAPAKSSTKMPIEILGQLVVENDTYGYAHTDKYYTSGVKANGFFLLQPETSLYQLSNYVPFLQDDGYRYLGFEVSQLMFTPEDHIQSNLIKNDRPYAGWLTSAIFIDQLTDNFYERWGVFIGFIGPSSLARESQDFVHYIKDVDYFYGWDNQLNNELAAMLTYKSAYKFSLSHEKSSLKCDFIPSIAVNIGTVTNQAGIGGIMRFGTFLPLSFGVEATHPMVTGSPNYQYKNDPNLYAYVYTGAETRLILHDVFLDGNLFSNSHSVNKVNFVFDYIVGFAIHYYDFDLGYKHVIRSSEFENQKNWHHFGSFTMNYHF